MMAGIGFLDCLGLEKIAKRKYFGIDELALTYQGLDDFNLSIDFFTQHLSGN